MASIPIETYQSAIGNIVAGQFAGLRQAQDEQAQQQQRDQQSAFEALRLRQSMQDDANRQAQEPFRVMAPEAGRMTPEGQGQFFGDYARAAGQPAPIPGLAAAAKLFRPGSPAAGVFGPTPGAPAAGPLGPAPQWQPGIGPAAGAPVPAPPAAAPGPGGGPMPSPGGVVPAPGASPSPIPPGAGGPVIQGPGGSRYAVQGVTPAQLKGLQAMGAQITRALENTNLSTEDRANLQQQMQGIDLNPTTPEGFAQSQRALQYVGSFTPGAGAAITGLEQQKWERAAKVHNIRWGQLTGSDAKTPPLSAADAAQTLVDLYDQEQDFVNGGGEQQTAQVIRNLQGYEDDIKEIRTGLAAPRGSDEYKAAVLHGAALAQSLRTVKPFKEMMEQTQTVMKVIGSLSPADQADPVKRAHQLEAAGLPDDVVKAASDPKARFGGAAAERNMLELLRTAKDYKNAPAEMKQFLVDQIIGGARTLGKKVTLKASDLDDISPLDAYKLTHAQNELALDVQRSDMLTLQFQSRQFELSKLDPKRVQEIDARIAETRARTAALNTKAAAAGKPGTAKPLTQTASMTALLDRERQDGHTYQADKKQYKVFLPADFDPDKLAKGLPKVNGQPDWSKLDNSLHQRDVTQSWWAWNQSKLRTDRALRSNGYDFNSPAFINRWGTPEEKANVAPSTAPPAAARPARAGGLKPAVMGGKQVHIDPAAFIAGARKAGKSDAWIAQQRSQMGF